MDMVILDTDKPYISQGTSILIAADIYRWNHRKLNKAGTAWLPDRPRGDISWWVKLRAVWLIISGKGDVVLWEEVD